MIAELIARHWSIRWGWTRDSWGEIVVEIVLLWKSDLQACASVIPVFFESDKFTVVVLPHGEVEAQPAAGFVVLVLHSRVESEVCPENIASYADELVR